MTRMSQHTKDVEHQRTNNAAAKHVQETNHEINWKEAECLEREKITYPRKMILTSSKRKF
jgi:hypothetical protein